MREGEELADWFGGQDTPWSHEAEQAVRAALESPLATDRLVIC